MATETVTTPRGTLTQQQIDTVNRAAYELQLVAKALQAYIESEDEHDTIHPVSRTMLKRIVALADAQGWALEPETFTEGGVDGLKRAADFVTVG